ncbi:MAG: DUF192 domain-containing protein [bacterium]|nr:DUF192 domain-containing protein [bacterium]
MRNSPLKNSILFGIFFFLLFACHGVGLKPSVGIINSRGDKTVIAVELARTAAEKTQGLMLRTDLAKNSGMLFVYETDVQDPFWMKNTLISLDIIFIGHNLEIISIAENTIPLSEALIPSLAPYRTVLEVNAGFVKKNGLTVGNKVILSL